VVATLNVNLLVERAHQSLLSRARGRVEKCRIRYCMVERVAFAGAVLC